MARTGNYRMTVTPVSRGSRIAAKQAVAVDPPAKQGSTLGIQDLLDRLEKLSDSDFFDIGHTQTEADPRRLNALADPREFTQPLEIEDWDSATLCRLLGDMLTIRRAEQALGKLVTDGHVVCPVHLAVGQEAIPVGISLHLTARDRVFGGHRSHGHYLAMGGDIYQLFAEVLGKADGCSRGMGGSMHLFAPEVGFWGSVPIVGATIPIAAGAALAAAKDGSDVVAVTYFGDGAAEEGVLHETLNLAAQMKLPVLFVCENNLYASHMDIDQRQPSDSISRFADAHGVSRVLVDGNDVVAVAEAAKALIDNARSGGGPGFLEAVTYRWCGHVGPDENIDVGIRRSAEELGAWKGRDPVARLGEALIHRGDVSAEAIAEMDSKAENAVKDAAARALNAPYPETSALLDYVYVDNGR